MLTYRRNKDLQVTLRHNEEDEQHHSLTMLSTDNKNLPDKLKIRLVKHAGFTRKI